MHANDDDRPNGQGRRSVTTRVAFYAHYSSDRQSEAINRRPSAPQALETARSAAAQLMTKAANARRKADQKVQRLMDMMADGVCDDCEMKKRLPGCSLRLSAREAIS